MTRVTIAACIAAIVVTAGSTVAQDRVQIDIAGRPVAFIRTGGAYGSMNARQAEIYKRITNAISNELPNIFVQHPTKPELDGPKLTVAQASGRWTLSIGNQMLIQAYDEDAAGAGTTTKALIEQWKQNFFRALPLAPSPKDVPAWWSERHPPEGPDLTKKMHNLPPEDAVLVRETSKILEAARTMSDEDFERLLPGMERSLIDYVWSYRHPACGAAPITENIRAKSALKRARGLSDAQYAAEQWWMAGLTIEKLRETMRMPAGVGPVPEQRDLPDFTAPTPPDGGVAPGPTPPQPEPPAPEATPAADQPDTEPMSEARLAPDTPLCRVALGSGLGPNNEMLDVGQQFEVDTRQLVVYLKIEDARPNTIIGITIGSGPDVVTRRLVRVSGDDSIAVTFCPGRNIPFHEGEYKVLLTVNGEDAGVVPFRVGPSEGTLIAE